MINIQYETARISCTEANAPIYRAIIDSGKPRKFKKSIDRKHDNLRRDYPTFVPGMTTGEYLKQYEELNSRLHLTPVEFTHANRAAPMLDPTVPEVSEDLDPDYVPVQAKRKPATAAQLRKACQTALDLLAKGDIDTAQCVLSGALDAASDI